MTTGIEKLLEKLTYHEIYTIFMPGVLFACIGLLLIPDRHINITEFLVFSYVTGLIINETMFYVKDWIVDLHISKWKIKKVIIKKNFLSDEIDMFGKNEKENYIKMAKYKFKIKNINDDKMSEVLLDKAHEYLRTKDFLSSVDNLDRYLRVCQSLMFVFGFYAMVFLILSINLWLLLAFLIITILFENRVRYYDKKYIERTMLLAYQLYKEDNHSKL
jgi:hypothetical protein